MTILIERFCRELPIMDRELQDHLYHPLAYFLAHILSNLPLFTLIAILFTIPVYFGTRLRINNNININNNTSHLFIFFVAI
jgi:ABC-type multidrug transport system permease subunit